MGKGRIEAFSDGVIAIIITIMVLELKVPHGDDLQAIRARLPVFLSYVLSFVFVGIYWNNHHHLMHAAHRVNAAIMWANLHLLFWLSLFPMVSAWTGENPFAPMPASFYGVVLLAASIAYLILQNAIIRYNGADSPLAKEVGKDVKGKISALLYLIGIGVAFLHPFISDTLYLIVALIWLVPDRRVERSVRAT